MAMLVYDDPTVVFRNGQAYTKATGQEEVTPFKGCLYLPDSYLTEAQKAALTQLTDEEDKKRYKACWYLASTTTAYEGKKLGDMKEIRDKSIYLHLLLDQCLKGERSCYEIPPSNRPEVSAASLAEAMDKIQTEMVAKYGNNGGIIMDGVADGRVLPQASSSLASAMVGYEPTLIASEGLAQQMAENMDKAKEKNVDPDAVALATALLATGQLAQMKAIMVEKAKGADTESPTMLKHIAALKVNQQAVLDSFTTPAKEESYSDNIRTKLNLTTYQWEVDGIPELKLLPLAHEIAAITKGPNALPSYMLLKLQESWKKEDKNVTIPKYVAGSKRKWLDNAVLAVHKNVHEIQDMKNTLWAEIGQNPEIENQLPECQKYARNIEFSYIRLVYELRQRLNHDSGQLVLYETYQKLTQRTGERATEFVARAASLREQAYCNRTDENYENVYDNPWDQHYETVLKGFSNKQLMGEISRINPKSMTSLRDAVERTESMFSRNIRLGLIQGQEDPRALVGLPMPSEETIQQIQAMTGNCYKCGDRDHFKDQCPCPTPVCYRCKKPGHIKIDCKVYVQQQPRGGKKGGKPFRGPAKNQADQKDTNHIQQLGLPGAAEAVWTPFSHFPGFPNGSQ